MSMAMGSAYTALRINNDKTKGFLTRLLSVPMKRWVILGSHIVASTIFMLISRTFCTADRTSIGLRPQATIGDFLLFTLLIVTFAVSLTGASYPLLVNSKRLCWSKELFSYIFDLPAFYQSSLCAGRC